MSSRSRSLSTLTTATAARPKSRLSALTNNSARPYKRPVAASTRLSNVAPPPLAPVNGDVRASSLGDILAMGREMGAWSERQLPNKEDTLKNEKANRANDLACLDITQPGDIDNKTARLHMLSVHLNLLLVQQRPLLVRLKQPYAGDCIRVEPEFHRELEALLPRAIRSIATVPADAENVTAWGTGQVSEADLDRLLASISTALAVYGNYADEVDQLGRTVREIQARIVSGEV
ncbi:hypothetical protein BC936DRAFT_149424 [Jimgerdemannia flammicorona]|uniref:Uncharacterized protein n=1 Tax=Jimgerdemannia flammicorona TaxID=994334 RepID=A0A433D0U5_9FUNG|nr:hypothetical protein BC936DRAFT_149424 [Jimgerdemannia flammicorona]